MSTHDDQAEAEPEPHWLRRTPIVPEEWWGPPLAQTLGSLVLVAFAVWRGGVALPVGLTTGAVGVAGAVALAIAGRRAYLTPSLDGSWRLHRTRVIVWSGAGMALTAFSLVIGAPGILVGVISTATGMRFVRRHDPTSLELRGEAATLAVMCLLSAVAAVVALTVPTVDRSSATRWIGWGIVIVPASAIAAVLVFRRSRRVTAPDAGAIAEDDPGTAP